MIKYSYIDICIPGTNEDEILAAAVAKSMLALIATHYDKEVKGSLPS